MRWKFFLFEALGIALVYPFALVVVIATDTWWGEAEFVRQVLFVSKRDVLLTFVRDWWSALPVALASWLLIRGVQRTLGLRTASWILGGLALVGIVMALFPPYLPMIFVAMLLVTVLLNLYFERHRKARSSTCIQ